MDIKPVPYKKTVFVCCNDRGGKGERSACADPGRDGLAILEALKHAIKEKGLKGKVRAIRSGCMDLCEKGPNVFVNPEGAWYSGVSLSDVPTLLQKLQDS